jgi:hypothetical protein
LFTSSSVSSVSSVVKFASKAAKETRVTDTAPSPFRRFPLGPALLCVACLAVCGYTWMRYSYAWEMTPDAFRGGVPHHEAYVLLRWRMEGRPVYNAGVWSEGDAKTNSASGQPLLSMKIHDGYENPVSLLLPHAKMPIPPEYTTRSEWAGRAYRGSDSGCTEDFIVYRSSRFHPVSIAGLGIGAMGALVFCLYLRAWRRERKAAA